MKNYLWAGIVVAAFVAAPMVSNATLYSGNGNASFSGAIGNGSLTLTDNGTTLSGTITRGSGLFNDALVIYIDSVAGGFADTSGFADGNDGLRKAISGFDGGSSRSLMTFASGFRPDYAIALGPNNVSFGGLWQLANGGGNSLNYISSANLSPLGNNSASTYTFSLSLASLGLTPNSGQSFELFGTYISDTGYRSGEALAGNDSGTVGYNSFTESGFGTYVTAVPEPITLALPIFGGLVLTTGLTRRFVSRRAAPAV